MCCLELNSLTTSMFNLFKKCVRAAYIISVLVDIFGTCFNTYDLYKEDYTEFWNKYGMHKEIVINKMYIPIYLIWGKMQWKFIYLV